MLSPHKPPSQQHTIYISIYLYIRNNFAGPVFGEKRARLAPAGRQHAFIVNS
jgi:hypothetical protein